MPIHGASRRYRGGARNGTKPQLDFVAGTRTSCRGAQPQARRILARGGRHGQRRQALILVQFMLHRGIVGRHGHGKANGRRCRRRVNNIFTRSG